jgi:hypothetical protein
MRLRGRERVSTAVSGWLPQGAPYVFSPADLTPVLWLDASDASTITSSGSPAKVSQWASKAGGYNAVQATGANQPTTGTVTINGLNAIDFDGTNDTVSVANFDLSGGQKFSVVAVFSAIAGAASNNALMTHTADPTLNIGAWGLFRDDSNSTFAYYRRDTVGGAVTATVATVSSTPKVYALTYDGTLSTNEANAWLNNNGSVTRSGVVNTNVNLLNATLFVGGQATVFFLPCQIAELVITKTALTTAEREALQTYLADKWGITF